MPSWFPGASLKREGRKLLPHVTAMIEEPYAVAQAALVRKVIFLTCQTRGFNFVQADGTAQSSVAASLTMQLNDKSTAEDIWLAKILPGNMYLGGADTVRFCEPGVSPVFH